MDIHYLKFFSIMFFSFTAIIVLIILPFITLSRDTRFHTVFHTEKRNSDRRVKARRVNDTNVDFKRNYNRRNFERRKSERRNLGRKAII